MAKKERIFKSALWILAASAVILGIFFRWKDLLKDSLWFDEIISLRLAQYPLGELFAGIMRLDSHPPLFLFLGKIWFFIFGASDYAARGLSAFIGSLSLFAVYYLARAYGGIKTAVAAVIIAAFHHFAMYYSQDFRSYILLFTLTALSLGLSSRWFLRRKPERAIWLLALVNTLLLYTHYYGLIVVFFENVVYILYADRSLKERDDRSWWGAQAIPFALFSLWLPGLSYHGFHLVQGHLNNLIHMKNLVFMLSPTFGTKTIFGHSFFEQAVPFIAFALYCFSLPFKFDFAVAKLDASRLLISLRKFFREEKTARIIFFSWLSGILLLALSFLVFLPTGMKLSRFHPLKHTLEGFLLHTVAFAVIACGAWVSFSLRKAEVENSRNEETLMRWVFGLFPLFAVFVVQLACLLFRPNYLPRNMIIILPSFICALAFTLSRIKNRLAWTILMTVIMAGLGSQAHNLRGFFVQTDYKYMAKLIENAAVKLGTKPAVVTLCAESQAGFEHYLRDYSIVRCRSDCDEKLKGFRYGLWVLHDISVGGEEAYHHVLKSHLKRHKPVSRMKSHMMRGYLLEY